MSSYALRLVMHNANERTKHELRILAELLNDAGAISPTLNEQIREATRPAPPPIDKAPDGQDEIAKTSGEAKNPGPRLGPHGLAATARDAAMRYASQHPIRAMAGAALGINTITGAAQAASRAIKANLSTSSKAAPRDSGQDKVAQTSGEASNPGPVSRKGARARLRRRPARAVRRRVAVKAPRVRVDRHAAMIATVTSTGEPVMRDDGKGTTVAHRQLVTNITMPATGTAFAHLITDGVAINPGMDGGLGAWLSTVAGRFEEYEVESLRYVLQPSAAATDRGIVAMVIDYDSSDQVPASMREMSSYKNAVLANVSELATCYGRKEFCVPNAKKLVRTTNNFSGDPRVYDYGRLFIAGEGLSLPAGTIIGSVWAEYVIRLRAPHVAGSSMMSLRRPRAVARLVNDITCNSGINYGGVFAGDFTNHIDGLVYNGNGAFTVPAGAWRVHGFVTLTITPPTAATGRVEITGTSTGITNYDGQSAPRHFYAAWAAHAGGALVVATCPFDFNMLNPESALLTMGCQNISSGGTTGSFLGSFASGVSPTCIIFEPLAG